MEEMPELDISDVTYAKKHCGGPYMEGRGSIAEGKSGSGGSRTTTTTAVHLYVAVEMSIIDHRRDRRYVAVDTLCDVVTQQGKGKGVSEEIHVHLCIGMGGKGVSEEMMTMTTGVLLHQYLIMSGNDKGVKETTKGGDRLPKCKSASEETTTGEQPQPQHQHQMVASSDGEKTTTYVHDVRH